MASDSWFNDFLVDRTVSMEGMGGASASSQSSNASRLNLPPTAAAVSCYTPCHNLPHIMLKPFLRPFELLHCLQLQNSLTYSSFLLGAQLDFVWEASKRPTPRRGDDIGATGSLLRTVLTTLKRSPDDTVKFPTPAPQPVGHERSSSREAVQAILSAPVAAEAVGDARGTRSALETRREAAGNQIQRLSGSKPWS